MAHNFAFLKKYRGMHKLHRLSKISEKAYQNGQYASCALVVREISGRIVQKILKNNLIEVSKHQHADTSLDILMQTHVIDEDLLLQIQQLRVSGQHPAQIDQRLAYILLVKLHYVFVWYVNHYLDGHEEADKFHLEQPPVPTDF